MGNNLRNKDPEKSLFPQSNSGSRVSATLNQENVLSATGKPFTPSMVKWIRYRYDIAMPSQKRAEELTVRQVADRLGVSAGVVYYWIERGHLPARRLEPGFPYWITLTADKEAELQAWITHSHRIKPQPFRTTAARGAL
ncbi:MAG: helix-turn-helix domain-containing protein [Verrucomicrobia bacterium]|nr:helix-turn-helix domain-containing protein [Verrucomicrobiota bacterium]